MFRSVIAAVLVVLISHAFLLHPAGQLVAVPPADDVVAELPTPAESILEMKITQRPDGSQMICDGNSCRIVNAVQPVVRAVVAPVAAVASVGSAVVVSSVRIVRQPVRRIVLAPARIVATRQPVRSALRRVFCRR